MQALVLFSLFCVFPALFCYTLETAEAITDDDESSLVDIAGEADVKVEASDPGLDSFNDALDILLHGTRNCPHCNGCKCYGRYCNCRKQGVVVYLRYSYYSCCGPRLGATFMFGGSSFYKSIPVTHGCHRVCGRNYCFNVCIQSRSRNSITGKLSQLRPSSMYIGSFNLNL